MMRRYAGWTSNLTCTLAVLVPMSVGSVEASEADGLRVTDYFISHTSNEPFYSAQKLDPSVTLHVREVVLAGRERTVAKDGRVLLLIHGITVPGYVAFDTDYENVSVMRHFARAGWDTFALDLEGYGLSTRPLVMEEPAAFPESKAPIHVDVTVRDVERVVDFITALRHVDRVHLLGVKRQEVVSRLRKSRHGHCSADALV
ncbi:MAG: alpha/beta hydrolase, partial [Nitrospiraceae bacterium]|nr:alpha/beta hydrolase [Nitrospiraceae bacterium]